MTETTPTNRPGTLRRTAGLGLALLGLTLGAGCRPTVGEVLAGTPTTRAVTETTSGALAPSEAMYCRTLAGREPQVTRAATAEQFRGTWDARRRYEWTAVVTASGPALDAWRTVEHFTRNEATAAVEAGGFRPESMLTEPPAVVTARALIATYDHDVCGRR